jgi:hypothetical protein
MEGKQGIGGNLKYLEYLFKKYGNITVAKIIEEEAKRAN